MHHERVGEGLNDAALCLAEALGQVAPCQEHVVLGSPRPGRPHAGLTKSEHNGWISGDLFKGPSSPMVP